MPIFAALFFALMHSHFMTLPLFTTRHKTIVFLELNKLLTGFKCTKTFEFCKMLSKLFTGKFYSVIFIIHSRVERGFTNMLKAQILHGDAVCLAMCTTQTCHWWVMRLDALKHRQKLITSLCFFLPSTLWPNFPERQPLHDCTTPRR
jgi:hypothetical protein